MSSLTLWYLSYNLPQGFALRGREGDELYVVDENNVKNGPYTRWQDGVKFQQGLFSDGLQDGLWETWWPSGRLRYSGNFRRGRWHGMWREFHENGRPACEGVYAYGKRVGMWIYWRPDKKIEREVSYADGLKDGRDITYHPNRQNAVLRTYSRGLLNGPCCSWATNGEKIEEGGWCDDQKHGTWKFYDNMGDVVRTEQWCLGRRTDIEE